jgi:hypothetical protein
VRTAGLIDLLLAVFIAVREDVLVAVHRVG